MNIRDRQICEKLLDEIALVYQLLEGFTVEMFAQDERTVRAVCMTLINIGELVKALTPEMRAEHSEIPWRAIAGMRDVTAHKYQSLKRQDVFVTCTADLPVLEKQLRGLLNHRS